MKIRKIWLMLVSIGVGFGWLLGCTGGEETAVTTPTPRSFPAGLYVDAAASEGTLSPLIYGTNYGPWVVVPADLLDEAEQAGITMLRFPGGNYGDRNNITERQINQLMTLAERMNSEVFINTRLENGTPEQSAELVRYTNIEQGYGVRYWGIGNEPTLFRDYDTERFNQEWRAHAEAMLAVDPDIILIGPEPHQYDGTAREDLKDENGIDFLTSFLEVNGDLVDIVAIHRYPFPASMTGTVSIEDLRQNSREWDTLIPSLRELIREKTGRNLPVAVTEVNSNWTKSIGGEATPDSFYNAIWWGDVLGRMGEQQVEIVNHFVIQTKDGAGGWGLFNRFEPRPTYYTYQMFKQFGQELLVKNSDDLDVPLYATLREDGALTVMVLNLGPEEVTKPLAIDNFEGELSERWLFDASTAAEQIDAAPLGESLTLPPQSMTLLVFK